MLFFFTKIWSLFAIITENKFITSYWKFRGTNFKRNSLIYQYLILTNLIGEFPLQLQLSEVLNTNHKYYEVINHPTIRDFLFRLKNWSPRSNWKLQISLFTRLSQTDCVYYHKPQVKVCVSLFLFLLPEISGKASVISMINEVCLKWCLKPPTDCWH